MEIKVLGAGCSSCSQLYSNVEQAIDELDLAYEAQFIHDISEALKYEVLQLPALVINEKVASFGKDLSVNEVKTILQSIQ